MKKVLLIFFLTSLSLVVHASHIVGGEFELRHISGNTYRLTLILYFDSINGAPGARDPQAVVRFFRKRDNATVFLIPGNSNSGFLTLPFDGVQQSVSYTNNECRIGQLVTNKLVYTNVVDLRDDVFNDPEGYYVAWERCCRNYTITNIFSQAPESGPNYAGQTFYLEFPPVVKNGEPFINNSPRLFPPLSDYACPRIPYYVDFAGIDDDGDSLVYSMVTPLSTHNGVAIPASGFPGPAPYPTVTWKPGFSMDNILNGLTNLEISDEGFLTVTPNSVGLYVFAVKCEEYRDGIKIGEVRRDFQMLVLDACPVPVPPQIVGRALEEPDFGLTGQLTVDFDNTVADADRCFEVKVSDPSTLLPDDNNQEKISIRAIPLGFKKNIAEVLPAIRAATITNGGNAVFRICLPKCPYVETGVFQIGIVAYDDACALPLSDTLIVTVNLEPPPNVKPAFNNPGGLTEIVDQISEGEPMHSWPMLVDDADGDVISYRLVPVDFVLEDFGMTFDGPLTAQVTGPISRTLTWNPKCDEYDFTEKSDFELYFIVEDVDLCKLNHADTTAFNLSIVDFSQITPPVIDNSILTLADTIRLTRKIYGEPIVINVTGTDVDNTNILLRGNGIDFQAEGYGVSFPRNFAQGAVQSQFVWQLTCDQINLDDKNEFQFLLTVVDSLNKCGFYKADTLHLIVTVEPPDNEAPDLSVLSLNANQPILDGTLTAILQDSISLSLSAIDSDLGPQDELRIELLEQTGNVEPTGYHFSTTTGTSPLTTSFTWNPECSVFENGVYENNYTFKFLVSDNRCFNEKGDTLTLALTVKDLDGGDDNFLPPNVFSPNGDDINDFFAMVAEVAPGEFETILPNDNCLGEFISIHIYNRWGKEVYKSANRNFRWYGEEMPVGVYYYSLKYTNKEYKGIVSIRF